MVKGSRRSLEEIKGFGFILQPLQRCQGFRLYSAGRQDQLLREKGRRVPAARRLQGLLRSFVNVKTAVMGLFFCGLSPSCGALGQVSLGVGP